MTMKKIFLVRHCSSTGQSEDAGLTAEGLAQSEKLGKFLEDKGIECIISSPSRRARESIASFATGNNITVKLDSRLRERVLSTRNLENWVECLEDSFKDRNIRFNNGETSNEAAERAFEVIGETVSAEFETVALVTHGNLMALILGMYDDSFGFREWTELSNPDVYLITLNGTDHSVERIWS